MPRGNPSPKLAITVDPDVHAPVVAVVAQASRAPAQVQLRRLLRGCEVVNLTERGAHAAGQLLGRAGTSDVVDAVVAHTAAGLRAHVVTGDRAGIARLLQAAQASCQIIDL